MPNCQVFPPAYRELTGCDIEPGSVVAVAFIDEDVTFTDITDAAEWTNLTYSTDILVHKRLGVHTLNLPLQK